MFVSGKASQDLLTSRPMVEVVDGTVRTEMRQRENGRGYGMRLHGIRCKDGKVDTLLGQETADCSGIRGRYDNPNGFASGSTPYLQPTQEISSVAATQSLSRIQQDESRGRSRNARTAAGRHQLPVIYGTRHPIGRSLRLVRGARGGGSRCEPLHAPSVAMESIRNLSFIVTHVQRNRV